MVFRQSCGRHDEDTRSEHYHVRRDRKRVESLAEIAKEKTYVSSAYPFSSSLTYDINVRSLRGFARKIVFTLFVYLTSVDCFIGSREHKGKHF